MSLPVLSTPDRLAAPGGCYAWSAGGQLISCLLRTCPTGGGWEPHTHEHDEVFWMVDGALDHRDGNGTRRLATGDCVFVAADHRHDATAIAGGASWININLHRHDCAALAALRPDRWPWLRPTPLHCRPKPDRLRALEAALVDLDPHSPIDRDWLILSCARLADDGVEPDRGPPPAWFSDTLHDLLAAHPDARPADLSRRSGRSTGQCNRIARRHYGLSCAALLIERRLALAAATLRGSDRPIAEIAAAHGFSNLSDFYRRFRARYGQQPGPYRRAGQCWS